MLVAFLSLSFQKNAITDATVSAVLNFLDYTVPNPDASITHFPSNMCLHLENNPSDLSRFRAFSCAGCHSYISDAPTDPNTYVTNLPHPNSIIHVLCQIMSNIICSVMEAEVGTTFLAA